MFIVRNRSLNNDTQITQPLNQSNNFVLEVPQCLLLPVTLSTESVAWKKGWIESCYLPALVKRMRTYLKG